MTSLIGHPISGRVFVLGAGFSHHLSEGRLPLLEQLSRSLQTSIPWLAQRTSQGRLDLERALTDLDLDLLAASDEDTLRVLQQRRTELVTTICDRIDHLDIPSDTLQRATKLCLELFSPGDYILTFNWDTLLDRILHKAGVWTPFNGYGWSMMFTQHGDGGRNFNPYLITLLKLHGSVNFRRPSYGGDHFEPTSVDQSCRSGPIDPCSNTQAPQPLLTLPTYVKQFAEQRGFVYIWREAIEAISRAETLVVIGYSLPRADALARLLFSFAGTFDPMKRVAVVDWSQDDCEHIQQQLREVATLHEDWPSFQEEVDWVLLPADSKSAYERLIRRLARWPKGNQQALGIAMASDAAFPDMLDLIKRMTKKEDR